MSDSAHSDPLTAPMPRAAGRPLDEGKRAAIVAAARDCFFEHGYSATSIEQIARRAGVSKVTVYNRFADKQALFVESVLLECSDMQDRLCMSRRRDACIFVAAQIGPF
ncbi:MAG: TetR/AcrR family transcriptional regulator [Sphingopyxis sp.]|nr:TetR/AcrR family transcriptional regulator [Sphingopyxis sp.]